MRCFCFVHTSQSEGLALYVFAGYFSETLHTFAKENVVEQAGI